jgi:hypothetical protein
VPALPFSLPEQISVEAGVAQDRSFVPVSYSQRGVARSTMAARNDVPAAAQISVNVQAMDSRSFLDHSDEIARAVRDAMLRRMGADKRFAAIDAAIAREGRKIALLIRLSPLFPFNVTNYALGLTAVRLRDYVFACIGMLPGTILYVYYGRVIGDVANVVSGATVPRGPEYWLVLVQQRAIEVWRDPDPATGTWRSHVTVSGDGTLEPSSFAGPLIQVRALFD